jgi:predicted TIM-barrel fold metal-dependent hydrolase
MAVDLVIDADGHCIEPLEGLAKWMPAEYKDRVPVATKDAQGQGYILIDGRLAAKHGGLGQSVTGPFAPHIVQSRPGGADAKLRLPDMDTEGVDVAVVFGTPIALTVNGLQDKELAAVLCRAVNRWLVEEYLPVDPKRLKGAGLIPLQDPAAAVKELEWLVQHRRDGIVTAMLPVNVYGINLGDRRFDPVYELAEHMGIPLAVHPQTGHDGQHGVWGVMGAGSERMEKYSYVHMTAFTFEPMIQLMHMIGEGVFDRYPRLKVAYVEGACGWLPFWASRLDEHFEKLRPQWHLCERKPSEIIKGGQIALTCEPEEEILPYVLETMGEHLVMYASDYPHWDAEYPESARMLASIPGMTEDLKRRVLGRNAIEWFGLTPEELPDRSVFFGDRVAVGGAR